MGWRPVSYTHLVLFDTERLTQQTWLAVSREMGWPQVGEAYLEFVGQNRADIFQKMEDLFGARCV